MPEGRLVTFESAAFPNVFLRLDGTGVTARTGPGAGQVNCQFGAKEWEVFRIVRQPNDVITIESLAFPGVYLRMDGTVVTAPVGPGGGTVNCQFGAYEWEQFRLEPKGEGFFAIASVAFPGVYLRMDGNGVTAPTGPGGGTVNCQFGAGAWERFRVATVPGKAK
ncbi:MAG: fascin domain-containing protein [Mycobacterium leprae]